MISHREGEDVETISVSNQEINEPAASADAAAVGFESPVESQVINKEEIKQNETSDAGSSAGSILITEKEEKLPAESLVTKEEPRKSKLTYFHFYNFFT